MTYLIDTNIISEVRKGERCDRNVAAWFSAIEDDRLFLSVLTLGEIRRGVERLRSREPNRAATLDAWLRDVRSGFAHRILPVDQAVVDAWGRMTAARSVPVVDALLAATAKAHDLTFATRNLADVAGLGARAMNPFEAPTPR